MKKIVSFAAIAAIILVIASCEKDAGNLPHIAFKTGSSYTATDITTDTAHVIKIGITASKAEDKDVLKTFDVSRSYDGAAAVSIQNASLSGSQGDNYSADLNFSTRKVAGTEKFLFTVVNRDGLKNTVSLTITVH